MKKKNQGFTLVEILIVVVILGILAAIVIPQFSDASTQSKVSSAKSSLQTLRSQLSLYKIQHNNDAPPTDSATFTAQMTAKTNAAGTAATTDGAVVLGKYLQSIPRNPFNQSSTIADADGAKVGWVYTVSGTDATIRLGGTGYTDLDSSDDNTGPQEEVHLNW